MAAWRFNGHKTHIQRRGEPGTPHTYCGLAIDNEGWSRTLAEPAKDTVCHSCTRNAEVASRRS